MVSQFYAPDEHTWEVFGPAAATLEPEAGCGRCPGCRGSGSHRRYERHRPPVACGRQTSRYPIPSPGSWPHAQAPPAPLCLTDEEPVARISSLAPLLWEAGVRYFAGVRDWQPQRGQWAFIDESLAYPNEAPPVPGFVVPHSRRHGHWPVAIPGSSSPGHARKGLSADLACPPGARVGGRPTRLFPTLNAATAERILKARPT